MKTVRRLVVLGAILALAGGCGDEQAGDERSANTEAPAETTAAEATDGPAVKVSADKTHAVQPGDEITVTVAVENFTLDAGRIGAANETGVGHYRLYLDEASGDDFLAESGNDSVKVKVPEDITDGSHPLRAVLYNNDGTPIDPPAEGEVWLIVYRL